MAKSSKYKWAGAHELMADKPQGNHTTLTNLYWDLCVCSFLNCDVSYPSVKLEEPISSLYFTTGWDHQHDPWPKISNSTSHNLVEYVQWCNKPFFHAVFFRFKKVAPSDKVTGNIYAIAKRLLHFTCSAVNVTCSAVVLRDPSFQHGCPVQRSLLLVTYGGKVNPGSVPCLHL